MALRAFITEAGSSLPPQAMVEKFTERAVELAVQREIEKHLTAGEDFTAQQVLEAVFKNNRALLEDYARQLGKLHRGASLAEPR
jgi:hypothetical protein